MDKSWESAIANEWTTRREADHKRDLLFPLAMNPFGEEEIIAMVDTVLSGRLTLGKQIETAEKKFAEFVGAPYAIMVNSGSSANLLAVSAIANKLRPVHCESGAEVLVPSVCWSTSVFPLIQNGLVPVFVDTDPDTFNVSIAEMERKMSPKVQAVMAVHVLGNSSNMIDLLDFVKRHNLILVEDTCESLGSFAATGATVAGKPEMKMLGTSGDFGTFSFYFSHHITSGEGGMVVCQTEEDCNFVKCLRAHGWSRHLTNRFNVENMHPEIDSRFLFLNIGYNLRPMEVQGAMLQVQLKKIEKFNQNRRDNLAMIKTALEADPRFANVMSLMKPSKGTDPAWFGLGAILHRGYAHQLDDYLKYLESKGVENRPVISGNFIRQPCIASYCPGEVPENYPGAEAIHTRGFFIGVHQIALEADVVSKLVDVMLSFPFEPHRVVLVTGSTGMLGHHIKEELAHSKNTEVIYLTPEDGDLRKKHEVESIFKKYQPTHVIHCAALLAAIQQMAAHPVEFWLDNVSINNHLLQTAHKFRAWVGPIKVVSVLSTVMFPKDATYPVGTDQVFSGPPHPAAEAYALAKRMLAHLSRWYSEEYGEKFVCVLPGNFFGSHGNFNPKTAPLVNALIAKSLVAKKDEPLPVMGTGKPIRQIMHASDLARIMVWALDHLEDVDPLIVAGEEVSIKEIAELVCEVTGFSGGLKFDVDAVDGPLRRSADISRFKELCPEFKFTSLKEGIESTVEWYKEQVATGAFTGVSWIDFHKDMAE